MPDLDMWLVCQDGCSEDAQEELANLLRKHNMCTSDENPLLTIEEIEEISTMIKEGKRPKIYLPIDAYIIEYSELKKLIGQVPSVLKEAKDDERTLYLPIHPISYRKQWQYDDEAYNFIYDYLSAFSEFNFDGDLQQLLNNTRLQVATEYTTEELFEFLIKSANEGNFRRFQSPELETYFIKRMKSWKGLKANSQDILSISNEKDIDDEDDGERF